MKSNRFFIQTLVSSSVAIFLSAATSARGDVQFSTLFSDGAVLQRGMEIPVWGSADPDEVVTIRFGGKEIKGKADGAGRWMVKLPALDAGVSGDLSATGKNTVVAHDVVVGEVWIASGQSNMAYTMGLGHNHPTYEPQAKQDVDSANDPLLRMFTVKNQTSPDQSVGNIPGPVGNWKSATPANALSFSAVAYHFAREIREKLGVPVGVICSSVGGTTAEAWTSHEALAAEPRLKEYFDRWEKKLAAFPEATRKYNDETLPAWQKASQQAQAEGKPAPKKPAPPAGKESNTYPSTLFNAMVNPLIPYGIRGVIWYQGEGNGGEGGLYKVLFPTLIADWRKKWGQGEYPFFYVQLANYQAVQTQPSEGGWALLREAQLQTLATTNTGMASAIDLADPEDPFDIHPHNKREVGRRLSLIALAKTYEQKLPSHSGPIYKEMKVEDNQVRLLFSHVDGGLVAKGDGLKGFAIAGKDNAFQWADARIDGDTVVVSNPAVPEPVAVRYGWAGNPIGNLYNKEGLPASPFRTDSFPLPGSPR